MTTIINALTVVHKQAEDRGLWFIPETITEDYLQRALRKLHAAVEGDAAPAVAQEAAQMEPAPQNALTQTHIAAIVAERDSGKPDPDDDLLRRLATKSNGMTLRQWYAGMAMQALVSHPQASNTVGAEMLFSVQAFAMADAMLEEGAKP